MPVAGGGNGNGNANEHGAALGPIYQRLNQSGGYHPFTAETFADWSLQAGDVVTMQKEGTSYQSPVHVARMVWRGAPITTLETPGNQERESVAKLGERKYNKGGAYYGFGNYIGRADKEFKKFETELVRTDELIAQYAREYVEDKTAMEGRMLVAETAIEQTSREIALKAWASDLDETNRVVGEHAAKLSVTAEQIEGLVTYTGYDEDGQATESLFTRITQTAQEISSVAAKTGINELGEQETLYSKISQTATDINALVVRTQDVEEEIATIEGTGVFMNSDRITNIVGKFTLDNEGNVHVIDGSNLYLDQNGASLAVYTDSNLTSGVLIEKITGDHSDRTDTVKMGTYINNQLDAGVMVTKITDPNAPLIVKTTFGTYINNDILDAGIMIEKINDNTTTSILGSKVIVANTNKTVDGKFADVEVEIAGKITASEVAATYATIDNLDGLSARFENLRTGQAVAPEIKAGTLSASTMTVAGNLYFQSSDSEGGSYRTATNLSTIAFGKLGPSVNVVATQNYQIGLKATTVGDEIQINFVSGASTANFKIADTQYYKNGVSAAKSAMGVTVDTDNGTVKSAESETKSVPITVMTGLVYSSSTHLYTASGSALADGNTMSSQTKVSGTEAYDDGVTDGKSVMGLVVNTNNGTITADESATKSVQITETVGLAYSATTHKYTAAGSALANGTTMASQTKVSGTEAFDAGTEVGKSAMGLTIDTSNSTVKVAETSKKTVTISAVAGIAYSSSTHKYTAAASAKADNTTLASQSAVSGTEAYDDGVSSVTITSVVDAQASGDGYNSNVHRTRKTIKATASNGAEKTVTFWTDGSEYSAGYTDGQSGGAVDVNKMFFVERDSSGIYQTIISPYQMPQDNYWMTVFPAYGDKSDRSTWKVGTSIQIRDFVKTFKTRSDTFTENGIYYPGDGYDGFSYVVVNVSGGSSEIVLASSWSGSGDTQTYTVSGSGVRTKSMSLTYSESAWSNNQKTITVTSNDKAGDNRVFQHTITAPSSGNRTASRTFVRWRSGSSLYYDGSVWSRSADADVEFSDGTTQTGVDVWGAINVTPIVNAVSVSRGSWSGGSVTLRPYAAGGYGSGGNYTISLDRSVTWSGNTATIRIYESQGSGRVDTGYSFDITASGGGGDHNILIGASSRYDSRPSGYTEIFSDAGAYMDLHGARAGYYTFKVTCGTASKWYYFRVGNP